MKKTTNCFVIVVTLFLLFGCAKNKQNYYSTQNYSTKTTKSSSSAATEKARLTSSEAISKAKQYHENWEKSIADHIGGSVGNFSYGTVDIHVYDEDSWEVTLMGTYVLYDKYGQYLSTDKFDDTYIVPAKGDVHSR